ncbi:MAG TPA: PilZ domain-containing protein [Kofleriaceae bacterium]|jgi:hypothetical protein
MLVEAFLLVEKPRQRLSHWTQALAPLDHSSAPPLARVTAHYDPDTDHAILGLAYDALALGDEGLAYVVEVALLAELGMIQPAELSEGDRRRFLGERLARCTVAVGDQRDVVGTLSHLVRRLRTRTPPPLPRPLTEPILLTPPRGTRTDIPKPRPTSPHIIARPRTVHRAETVEMDPDEARRMAAAEAAELPPAPARTQRARSPAPETDPYMPAQTEPPTSATIYARYLRSGRWLPIRIGALSLKGAALMAGALPRVQDHVDVALAFGGHRALVRGSVGKVSTMEEAAASGAATFSVAFELDDASRRQLTALLTAARAARVTIKPPPPRQARRFPVEWPICLGTMRGAVRADALDVSSGGMFVRPMHPLATDTNVNFSAVLDDGAAPVAGRARVVRHVTEADATLAGLAPGYGLHVTEMADIDAARWAHFLARVGRRAEKRVIVGAAPARLSELQGGLSAAGYAVIGGTDPEALVALASADARPVDAALIDAAWLLPGAQASWVESLFSARGVPCVTMRGDARRARLAIDKLLGIATPV